MLRVIPSRRNIQADRAKAQDISHFGNLRVYRIKDQCDVGVRTEGYRHRIDIRKVHALERERFHTFEQAEFSPSMGVINSGIQNRLDGKHAVFFQKFSGRKASLPQIGINPGML